MPRELCCGGCLPFYERRDRPAQCDVLGVAQVAAYTSGRKAVNKFDCLLLQHVLWQRPDESQRIADFVLERMAVENSSQQTDYLFNGRTASPAGHLCRCLHLRRHSLLHAAILIPEPWWHLPIPYVLALMVSCCGCRHVHEGLPGHIIQGHG